MGRTEDSKLSAAQIFYPCMQAADIFNLKVDIAQLGMDQRKVNVLAREVAPKIGKKKPIAVHHHMLMGLTPPVSTGKNEQGTVLSGADAAIAKKMSKSNPNSAIFMTDTDKEITKKFQKAYCPEGEVEDNPILEYCKYIVFELIEEFVLERPEKFGGNLSYKSYSELETAFKDKLFHPLDLKLNVARYISSFLEPIRKHFAENEEAKALLEKVESYQITR
jgi:tyrosyl-tRNA synthetase